MKHTKSPEDGSDFIRFQSISVAELLITQLITEFPKLVVPKKNKDERKEKRQVQREAMTAQGTAHCTTGTA